MRLKDLPFADLTKKYVDEMKINGKINNDVLEADILAYQGKYQEAASLYIKAGKMA